MLVSEKPSEIPAEYQLSKSFELSTVVGLLQHAWKLESRWTLAVSGD